MVSANGSILRQGGQGQPKASGADLHSTTVCPHPSFVPSFLPLLSSPLHIHIPPWFSLLLPALPLPAPPTGASRYRYSPFLISIPISFLDGFTVDHTALLIRCF